MRALGIFLLSLLILMPRADAKPRSRPPTPQQNKYMNRLLQKCSDGQGQSCFDYAQILRQTNAKANEKKIRLYTRRACTLAYAPACGRPEKPVPARMAGNQQAAKEGPQTCGTQFMSEVSFSPVRLPSGADAQQVTRLQKGSVLDKAGVKLGDLVTKVNGADIRSSQALAQAMEEGGALIEVTRGSSLIPLALRCP